MNKKFEFTVKNLQLHPEGDKIDIAILKMKLFEKELKQETKEFII